MSNTIENSNKRNASSVKLVVLIITCVLILAVSAGLIVGNVLCFQNYNLVTAYMCGQGFTDNGEAAIAARSSGYALAATVEEEGAILLKNDNNTLPLAENTKVNVFGAASSDSAFIPQGTGSGTGSRNDFVTLMKALKYAGGDSEEVLKYAGKQEYEPGGNKAGDNPFANGKTGLEYNETLAEAYAKLGYSRVNGGSYVIEATSEELYRDYYGIAEAPKSFFTGNLTSSAYNFSDTAIVVIGRLLGEGNDYSKYQYVAKRNQTTPDTTRKLQSLSEDEEYMLEQASTFDKVILLINSTNPMELGFIEDSKYNIDSVIWMGTPGTRGTLGIASLLVGAANPSGHLPDTWAYDISTAASYATAGREGVGSYTDIAGGEPTLSARVNKYTDYIEDIYVGYKWYETADADGFWNTAKANTQWGIKSGYKDVVQFPFGFGMSYTEFKWDIMFGSKSITQNGETKTFETNINNNAQIAKDGEIKVAVEVTNTGDVAGKDVVQLYYSAPYKKGEIEKSAINLGAFEKTGLIGPGQTELLQLTMKVEDMKSYDCYDKNNNGFMGYELEGGAYQISIRNDVHTPADMKSGINTITVNVPSGGYRYEVDTVTNTKVENQFTTFKNTTSGAESFINEYAAKNAHSIDGNEEPVKINYMTRADFAGTFPYEKPENRAAGDALINDALYVVINPPGNAGDVAPESGSTATSWKIADVMGLDYEDEKWDQIISQLSLDTKCKLITHGGFGTIAIDGNPRQANDYVPEDIGKPGTTDTDGPAGFNNNVVGSNDLKACNYPSPTILAATWDWYMAYQVGKAIGIEGTAIGIQGWYGPGANLHRSATGGRNFEYYSEDPRLSGIICAYHVLGAKEEGVTAYIKHIAVNDTESGRNGAFKWLTEQNLRENYMLPFEYAVKVGKSNGMMSSVDRVGGTRVSGSYAMLTTMLRDEWGFRGTVITDYYQNWGASGSRRLNSELSTDTIHDVDECVRAGNSQILWTVGSAACFDDRTTATAQLSIHNSAKDILFAYADTLNYKATAQGLSKESMIGASNDVFAWWVILLVGIDVTATALMGFWLFLVIRSYKKKPPAVELAE